MASTCATPTFRSHSPTTRRRRILVIADETAAGPGLTDAIRRLAGDRIAAEVVVVAPALNSRLRHWVSDVDEARRRAELRLVRCIDRLSGDGLEADGWVGGSDPLQAIEDALHLVAADAIVLATPRGERSNRLGRDLVARARRRFEVPIARVVVDDARAWP